jgi:hypothetical protein
MLSGRIGAAGPTVSVDPPVLEADLMQTPGFSRAGIGHRSGSTRGRRADQPAFEFDRLEDRIVLATAFWDGGAETNSWHDKANWSNDTLPQPGDDVVISVQEDPNVAYSSGNLSIASLTTNENFSITAGGLSVTGDFTANQHAITVGGGTLGVAGLFRLNGGELRYQAGTINGSPELSSAALKLTGGVGAATFILGGGSSIEGNIGAAQTVWVRGANFGTNANVKAPNSLTNAGTLRLESQDLEWETYFTITSGTLTNTGTIEINQGSNGPNRIIGSVENKGTFEINAGAPLSLELGGGKTFTQSAGSMTVDGSLTVANGAMTLSGGAVTANGSMRVAFGSLSWTGGTLGGEVTIAGAALTLGPGATSAVTLIIHGSVDFAGNIASAQTVWVQGSDDLGLAQLHVATSFTNAGLLRLESVNNEWDSALTLNNNAVLTSTGTFEANLGSLGTRSISGKIINEGVVSIESGVTLFVGAYTQSAGGHLVVGIEGPQAGEFGKVQSSGAVSLAGEFEAVYVGGYVPALFDSIRFISGSPVTGAFSTLTLPFEDPDPDVKTLLVYSGTDVRLLHTSTADVNNDGTLDLFDFLEFVNLFNAQDPEADFTGDGVFDLFDFLKFINVFNK